MSRTAAFLLLVCACASVPAREPHDPAFTLDEVFGLNGRVEGPLPFRFAFNHDSTKLAYLKGREKGPLTDLWVYDLRRDRHEILLRAEGREKLTADERAARERRRDRTHGIGRYWWNPHDDTVLVALSGDLHLLEKGALHRLTETKGAERSPRWSPDGQAIAYVRNKNLYVRRGARERKLTEKGGGDLSCGLADFIAAEELGRHEGFWWSPDSQSLAYVEVDESAVPTFFLHDYLDVRGKPVEQTYPRAGDPNPRWKLRVVPASGGPASTVDVSGEYLVRVDWIPDGALAVQVSDRAQRKLTLYRCDPASGAATVLLEETDDAWVPFHGDLRFLDDGRFFWMSERSGRRRVYLWREGALEPVTPEGYDVGSLLGATPEGIFHFTASRGRPNQRLVYACRIGEPPVAVVATDGWQSAVVSGDGRWVVLTHSTTTTPPASGLVPSPAGPLSSRLVPLGVPPVPPMPVPEFVTIPADDGTPLHAMLYRPKATGGAPGPALVHCYGGPGSHLVADRWRGATGLWHARMVAKGYTVLTVDNRGAGGYGRDFCRVVSGRLCDYEVRDQAAAARWLGRQPYVDADRVGIWGWSYGGTLTLMCLLHAPDAFAAGVAVAPVTDWRDYDTAYTERYLSTPQENAEGYALSSPVTRADTLNRPLFLAHGLMDDNVHFRGAASFLDKVQRAGRPIEVDFYPRGMHGIGDGHARKLLFTRMERFWKEHLGR